MNLHPPLSGLWQHLKLREVITPVVTFVVSNTLFETDTFWQTPDEMCAGLLPKISPGTTSFSKETESAQELYCSIRQKILASFTIQMKSAQSICSFVFYTSH